MSTLSEKQVKKQKSAEKSGAQIASRKEVMAGLDESIKDFSELYKALAK